MPVQYSVIFDTCHVLVVFVTPKHPYLWRVLKLPTSILKMMFCLQIVPYAASQTGEVVVFMGGKPAVPKSLL